MPLLIPLKRTGQVDLMGPMLLWVEERDCLVDSSAESHESVLADVARLEALRKKVADAPAILQSQSYVNGPTFNTNDSSSRNNETYSLEDVYIDHIEYHACLMECESRGLFDFTEQQHQHQQQHQQQEGLSFEWSGAFHESDSGSSTSLIYERLAVLFNIGALESTLAARDIQRFKQADRDRQQQNSQHSQQNQNQNQQEPQQSLLIAVRRYHAAASIFGAVRHQIKRRLSGRDKLTSECSSMGLKLCETLMLAQGQWVLYQMALHRKRPQPLLLSKIATGAVDLFYKAYQYAQDPSLKETVVGREWCAFLPAVAAAHAAWAEYHESQSAQDRHEYGLELARLQHAQILVSRFTALCRQALEKDGGGGRRLSLATFTLQDVIGALVEEMEGLASLLDERYEEADREYAEKEEFGDAPPVPSIEELPARIGHNVMKKREPLTKALVDPSVVLTSEPLFSCLEVPMEATAVAAMDTHNSTSSFNFNGNHKNTTRTEKKKKKSPLLAQAPMTEREKEEIEVTKKIAVQFFREELKAIVNRTSSLVKEETDAARNGLAKVNLPQSLATYNASMQQQLHQNHGSSGMVPQELWERVAEIQEERLIETLKQDLWSLKDASETARGMAMELSRTLDGDLEMDRMFRDDHTNFEGHSAEEVQQTARQSLKSCEGWLEKARIGDSVLLKMLHTLDTDPKFQLVSQSRAELNHQVMVQTHEQHKSLSSSSLYSKQDEKKLAVDTTELGNLLVELSALITERDVCLGTLHEEARDYSISDKLNKVDPLQPTAKKSYEEVVRMGLFSFRGLVLEIQQNVDKQPILMDRILSENRVFLQAREAEAGIGNSNYNDNDNNEGSDLDKTISQFLFEAISTLHRVKKQLKQGRKFYDDVMPRLNQLKQQVADISVRLTVQRCEYEDKLHQEESERKDAAMAASLSSGLSSGNGTSNGASDNSNVRFTSTHNNNTSSNITSDSPAVEPPSSRETTGQTETRYGLDAFTNPSSATTPLERRRARSSSRGNQDKGIDGDEEAVFNAFWADVNHTDATSTGETGAHPPGPSQPGSYHVAADDMPQVRVDDEKVASLVGMDFDPERVVLALSKYDNNVELALNELLSVS